MSDSKDIISKRGEFLLYQTEDGRTQVEVRFDGETVWLSLGQMADLFQRDKSFISRHIKNIFDERELRPGATVAKHAKVQREGERDVTREVEYYNLDVIRIGWFMRPSITSLAAGFRGGQPTIGPRAATPCPAELAAVHIR